MAFSDFEKFTLESIGMPELWIKYKRPGMLTYKEMRQFISSHKMYDAKQEGQPIQTMKEFLEDADAELEWVMSLIIDWNLTHKETGELLPPPSKEKSSWMDVRGMYIPHIIKAIKDDPTGKDFLFPETPSLSPTLKQLSMTENQKKS
jgi:hypothetical protein